MFVIPFNGTAIMGAYVSTDGYVYVMGILPKTMQSIDGSYQFKVMIGY